MMIFTFRGVHAQRLTRWGRGLLWGMLGVVGLLAGAYLLLGVTVVVSCGLPPARAQALPVRLAPPHAPVAFWPLIIGHRGSTYWCQPNTLGCLTRSLALGATMLEVDIRLSADDFLIAFHDADVDRQTNGTGAVHALTWAQLRALYLPPTGPPPAGTGTAEALQPHRIALLDEVRQGFPAVPLLLDVKTSEPRMDAALAAFVRRFEAADFERIYIKTRNQRLADRLRRLPRPPKTGLTLCERVAFVAFPGLVTAPPGLLDLPLWLVSPSLIRRAAMAGHLVVVSLVNEAPDWHRALALPGLFGIVTDHPEVEFPRPPSLARRRPSGRSGQALDAALSPQ